MTETTKTKDRADTAREMIKAEADHIEAKQIAERGSLQDARVADKDYIRGKIDGLRQAEGLLSEGT